MFPYYHDSVQISLLPSLSMYGTAQMQLDARAYITHRFFHLLPVSTFACALIYVHQRLLLAGNDVGSFVSSSVLHTVFFFYIC